MFVHTRRMDGAAHDHPSRDEPRSRIPPPCRLPPWWYLAVSPMPDWRGFCGVIAVSHELEPCPPTIPITRPRRASPSAVVVPDERPAPDAATINGHEASLTDVVEF